jgi:hypothetical protein
VHFELIDNGSVETVEVDDIREVTEERVIQGYDESAIFKNFKVNKFTFNFFLKNLQFSSEFNRINISRKTYNSDQEGTEDGTILGGDNLPEIKIESKKRK